MLRNHERTLLIEQFSRGHQQLAEVLDGIPTEALQWKPAPDKWSIHEIIVHIVDSEANDYVRLRAVIAEPGKTIMAYEQDAWATELGYDEQEPDESLELVRLLRRATHRLLLSTPDSSWNHTVHHPERGMMMLDDLLENAAEHVPIHVEQIKRTYREWQAVAEPTTR